MDNYLSQLLFWTADVTLINCFSVPDINKAKEVFVHCVILHVLNVLESL